MTDAGGLLGRDTSGIWDKTEEQDFVKLMKELDRKSNSALSQPELLLFCFLAGIIGVCFAPREPFRWFGKIISDVNRHYRAITLKNIYPMSNL